MRFFFKAISMQNVRGLFGNSAVGLFGVGIIIFGFFIPHNLTPKQGGGDGRSLRFGPKSGFYPGWEVLKGYSPGGGNKIWVSRR